MATVKNFLCLDYLRCKREFSELCTQWPPIRVLAPSDDIKSNLAPFVLLGASKHGHVHHGITSRTETCVKRRRGAIPLFSFAVKHDHHIAMRLYAALSRNLNNGHGADSQYCSRRHCNVRANACHASTKHTSLFKVLVWL
ncbi:hypothetical protein TNCV_3455571 [Trichonephila clavipes]|nr:hypothetical protein TNCV_3455571 [Trichonephila clavipes]